MALRGTDMRRCARTKKSSSRVPAEKREWGFKLSEPCTSVPISQKRIAAAHDVKHQGSLSKPSNSLLMAKFNAHISLRHASKIQTLRDSNPPANQKQVVEKRSNTWPILVQCAANARLCLRRATN
ncbi:hypothetical protein K503DRAFT_777101 [Rhizopogon vinicolor AM-OR11-026]|uniref:Uncharacterized protein n=1 Tax=Rhizopogon vinicolor AM-OR11-026 TaxID=1314800 RepID=A0A1B7MHB8_9AGAM|nr:hypothetical protein K503DRAFT_777101 [Rhizopogon vinicolor AM-OR11-026]